MNAGTPGPLAHYRAAHAAHLKAREWEQSGEAFDYNGPGSVEAAFDALLSARLALADLHAPPEVREAFDAAQAAYDAADAAGQASEGGDTAAIDADEEAWDELCEKLIALAAAFDAAGPLPVNKDAP